MATRFAAVRHRGALRPCDDDGRDTIRALTPGKPVLVEVSQSRSTKQHRLYFAMLRKVHENLPDESRNRFPTVDALREAVQLACGWFERFQGLDGRTYLKAKSIAWDKMDQDEFGLMFREAMEVLCRYVIEDLDNEALVDELQEMLS